MKRLHTLTLTTLTAATLTLGDAPPKVHAQALTQDPVAAGASASQGSIQQTVQSTTLSNLRLPGLGGGATNPAGIAGTAPFNPANQTGTSATNPEGALDNLGLGPVQPAGGLFGIDVGGALNRITGGFLGDIANFLSNLPKGFESWIGGLLGDLGFSDTQEANTHIEAAASTKSSTAGTAIAEALELNIPGKGSYSVRQDVKAKAERDTAMGIANSSALNKNAQKQLKERAEQAQAVTEQTVQLAEDSKQRDVTQQILQNVSGQTALAAQIGNEQLKEAQQARIDRAIGNVIQSQQARILEERNTSERRQGIAAGNVAIQQTGLMALPGGFYLGSPAEGGQP